MLKRNSIMKAVKGTLLCLFTMLFAVHGFPWHTAYAAQQKESFADVESINTQYRHAVEMLQVLDIFSGDENGNFLPNDQLTRAQLCTISYAMLNGGNTDASGYADRNYFTDVNPGGWYAGYVNWARVNGIVNGITADGSLFAPDKNVTLAQACVMLLSILGYDSSVGAFDINGDWAENAIYWAEAAGLLFGIENATENAHVPLTREQTAQMVWNSLSCPMVVEENGTFVLQGDTTQTLAGNLFQMQSLHGVIVACETGAEEGYEKTQYGQSLMLLNTGETVTLPVTSDSFYFGIQIEIMAKAVTDDSGKIVSVSQLYNFPDLSAFRNLYGQ